MTAKQLKLREERSAAIAKEIAELNGEIERLKCALEHPNDMNEPPAGNVPNPALRMAISPPGMTTN